MKCYHTSSDKYDIKHSEENRSLNLLKIYVIYLILAFFQQISIQMYTIY